MLDILCCVLVLTMSMRCASQRDVMLPWTWQQGIKALPVIYPKLYQIPSCPWLLLFHRSSNLQLDVETVSRVTVDEPCLDFKYSCPTRCSTQPQQTDKMWNQRGIHLAFNQSLPLTPWYYSMLVSSCKYLSLCWGGNVKENMSNKMRVSGAVKWDAQHR